MSEIRDDACSIVDYMGEHNSYKCGYCKSNKTNFSHGMWAHCLSVSDYQDLIDRGWRRSGRYCYKPTMNKICCPLYTIKCDAVSLKLSKTQKKVLKRMHRFLSYGKTKEDRTPENDGLENTSGSHEYVRPHCETQDTSSVVLTPESLTKARSMREQNKKFDSKLKIQPSSSGGKAGESSMESMDATPGSSDMSLDSTTKIECKKGIEGPDPSKPRCRKAKEIRREKREAKLAKNAQAAGNRGESPMETKNNKKQNTEKTLEDFLNEPLPSNPAHNLEVKLVRSHPASAEFLQTFKMAHKVYEKYQINIHRDTADDCHEAQYRRFLCNSPLEEWKPDLGPDSGYGSFHHQYWLDGRLIAVGVLDILPYCVSSVYLYYDPEFSFLSLGTYASLRELALTRQLQHKVPALKWYYLGFYVHSCPKMRYKGKYTPSFLLCPETYTWLPIEKAVLKLDVAKYSRLNEDVTASDENGEVDINMIPVLYQNSILRYTNYKENSSWDEEQKVQEYATFVGSKTVYNMILHRST